MNESCPSYTRKYFNNENFPIYGSTIPIRCFKNLFFILPCGLWWSASCTMSIMCMIIENSIK